MTEASGAFIGLLRGENFGKLLVDAVGRRPATHAGRE